MFRKEVKVKSSVSLTSSEKKQFRKLVEEKFFDKRLNSDEDSKATSSMPADLRSQLVKQEVALWKIIMKSGEHIADVYAVDKTPLLLRMPEGDLVPTVYLLWRIPDLLHRFYTPEFVVEKLATGADLMLPGIIVPRNTSSETTDDALTAVDLGNLAADTLCSVCVAGNRAASAVGRTLMSSEEMVASGMTGKGVRIIHTYKDNLWKLGPKTRLPENSVYDSASVRENQDDGISTEGKPELHKDAEEPVDLDRLFLLYFLMALQKTFKRDDALPCLASTFYGNSLLSLMPDDHKVPIQKTTYKKFSAFLRQMQTEGLVVIEEPKKGVENIKSIRRDHPFFGDCREELKNLPLAQKQQEPSSDVAAERPVNFRELRTVTASVLPLFHTVNKDLKKGKALSASDVKAYVRSYAKSKDLADSRTVKLDELLLSCINHGAAEKFSPGTELTWEELNEAVFSKLTPCIEIQYADQAAASSGVTRTEIRKGKPPTVRMKVAKRGGNKKVTLVDNLEAFGVDLKALTHQLQTALACSVTVNEDVPGVSGVQVQVQGDQTKGLTNLLTEQFGIAKKYIKSD